MISLNDIKTVNHQTASAAHLVILRDAGRLAIVATDRIPQLVHFIPNAAPQVAPWLADQQAPVVDLGVAAFRTRCELDTFSWDTQYSKPGNAAVDEEGAWVICVDSTDQSEAWLNIKTGRIDAPRLKAWYVPQWELGIYSTNGEFQALYARY
jgi:hypothetical protein